VARIPSSEAAERAAALDVRVCFPLLTRLHGMQEQQNAHIIARLPQVYRFPLSVFFSVFGSVDLVGLAHLAHHRQAATGTLLFPFSCLACLPACLCFCFHASFPY
jgi:hypothetical protein